MKPTDEQLRDPKWWDENAPSDAEHLAIAPDDTIIFYRQDSVDTWQIWGVRHKQWMFDGFSHDAGKPPYELTPRPTKLAAPEWNGEGLPPVGCECEVLMGSYWYRCDVLGRSDEALWVKAHDRQDYWTIMNGPSVSVRPLRTKEHRERKSIISGLVTHIYATPKMNDLELAERIAIDLFVAGYRKEKQDD